MAGIRFKTDWLRYANTAVQSSDRSLQFISFRQ